LQAEAATGLAFLWWGMVVTKSQILHMPMHDSQQNIDRFNSVGRHCTDAAFTHKCTPPTLHLPIASLYAMQDFRHLQAHSH